MDSSFAGTPLLLYLQRLTFLIPNLYYWVLRIWILSVTKSLDRIYVLLRLIGFIAGLVYIIWIGILTDERLLLSLIKILQAIVDELRSHVITLI